MSGPGPISSRTQPVAGTVGTSDTFDTVDKDDESKPLQGWRQPRWLPSGVGDAEHREAAFGIRTGKDGLGRNRFF